MAVVHPSLNEVARLATPLNTGEQRILDLLCERLDQRWHIFVQPHLLNQQPDFVVASEHHGVTVIEVKDWVDGGHRSVGGHLEVNDTTGAWHRCSADQDPMMQAHRYRSGIAERYLTPPMADSLFSAVHAVVAMPQWSSSDALKVLRSTSALPEKDTQYIRVVGKEAFDRKLHFDRLVYGGNPGPGLAPEVLKRLLTRMEEPEATADQRRQLLLSPAARNVETNPANATIRRIRGPAGSGKTIGLAARAARLALDGQRVLVLSFNITLAHYIQDLVRRHAREVGADHRLVDCIHIHGFCGDLLRGRQTSDADHDERVDDVIRKAQALYERSEDGLEYYDAVLVDEGQDFTLDWWNFLRRFVRRDDNGEMLLAADATQDIYERRAWTDETRMLGSGFSGPWTRLSGCYRLPADLIPIVSEFAKTFLGGDSDLPEIPNDHTGFASSPTERRWVNAVGSPASGVSERVAQEIVRLLELDGGPHQADTTYLTNNHEMGLTVAERLVERGLMVEHIFAESDEDQRRGKRRFWPGVAMLKGSTVHSFKGWESRAVVIVTDDAAGAAAELAYVALSRVKGDPANRSAFVTVINTVPFLESFKDRFERQIGPDEISNLAGQTQLNLA